MELEVVDWGDSPLLLGPLRLAPPPWASKPWPRPRHGPAHKAPGYRQEL